MDKDIEKFLRDMQTSVYDQISGLKNDVYIVTKESQTALEICAELEKIVNTDISQKESIQKLSETVHKIVDMSTFENKNNILNFGKIRLLSGVNYVFWHLSIQNLYNLLPYISAQDFNLNMKPISELFGVYNEIIKKIDKINNLEELNSFGTEIVEKVMTIQKNIHDNKKKRIDKAK